MSASGIEWADSAAKHGIDRADALHAMLNAYVHVAAFDEARQVGSARPDLWIGPQRTLGRPLLEVMAEVSPPRGMVVFHVMEARSKFLALLEGDEDE